MHFTQILIASAALAVAVGAAAQSAPRKTYIVQLKDAPIATYGGGISGYTATQPTAGSRIDFASQAVQNYAAYLDSRAASVASVVPSAQVLRRYNVAISGFAAKLTDVEVGKLRSHAGVALVEEDRADLLDTSFTSSVFLGLGQPGGAWSRTDAQGRPLRGEDVIVGIIDGGVWPENPAFSDRVDANGVPLPGNVAGGTLAYQPLPAGRWRGACVTGEGFPAGSCNNKLIGARFYTDAWLTQNTYLPQEFRRSPRDSNGHGTHVASTAAGNANAPGVLGGGHVAMTGVAPRARVAVYKTCWSVIQNGAVTGSCFGSDRVAAIEDAVRDGVDVINHSIGMGASALDAVSTAFRNATRAGVFVAGSGGNSGPGAGTVSALAPWMTSTANSTHSREFVADLQLGNGVVVRGASINPAALPASGFIAATDAGVTPWANLTNDADRLALARCYNAADRAASGASAAAAIDPARVAGRIVVCYRGGNNFVNKHNAVQGAAGMVIQNIPTGSIFASADTTFPNSYPIPTVHVASAHAGTVLGYAAQATPSAAISARYEGPSSAPSPLVASGSSRGPNTFDQHILKPDLSAPGTDIIAAYVPEGFNAAMRDTIVAGGAAPLGTGMISGTSMASPHVAGAAALLRQANPGWSPAAIKSALMTSASQNLLLANGAPDTNRFNFGSGHLNPNAALSTALVYEATPAQFDAYAAGSLDGRALNLASITNGAIVGAYTQRRVLTNRGARPVTLTATASLPGFDVTVTPATLTIPAGGSAAFNVRLARTTAAIGAWQFGQLVWSGSGQTISSPLTARPNALIATQSFTDTRAAGSRLLTVATGYDGTLVTRPVGTVPAVQSSAVAPLNPDAVIANMRCRAVTVPAGALALRAQTFSTEVQGGSLTDTDLYILNSAGTSILARAETATSDELISVANPPAGTYQACVSFWGSNEGRTEVAFTLNTWVVPASGPATLTAGGPSWVTTGGTASIAASWNIPATERHLGVVGYSTTPTGAFIGSTTLLIDPLTRTQAAQTAAPLMRQKDGQ
jgi:subtilisin family serine protease